MYRQSSSPYPSDWWRQRSFLDVTREQWAWTLIWLGIAVAFGTTNWDRVFGRRDHQVAGTSQVVAKK